MIESEHPCDHGPASADLLIASISRTRVYDFDIAPLGLEIGLESLSTGNFASYPALLD